MQEQSGIDLPLNGDIHQVYFSQKVATLIKLHLIVKLRS